MAPDVSDQLLDRLEAWGVKRIYGYPGDGINGVFGALRRAGERFEFVQARHEEMAAFMACAHAKYTGELGVVVSTSGPGAIHLLNGLYDAKLDHQPVLALVGQQSRAALGSSYLQEVDLRRAAEVLNAGEQVASRVGQGALGAGDEVAQVADALGAGVAKALLGKPVLPDDLPFVTGGIGLLGTKPSWDLMSGCDTLLLVGSGFPSADC